MRRSGLSNQFGGLGGARRCLTARALAALILIPAAVWAQDKLTREGDRWVETITGAVPAAARLRVQNQGPVRVEGGLGNRVTYTARVSVRARSEAEARRMLERFLVRTSASGEWAVLTAGGGQVTADLVVRAPRLGAAVISTSEGAVEATGIDGYLTVDSRAGEVKCDRVRGDCRLITGGGDIQAGEVGGALRCVTGGGRVTVKTVRGDAVLETAGGDIEVAEAGAGVHAETAGGAVRVTKAAGPVSAATGGGPIIIGKAGGIVITRNMAGPVQVGSAAGVRSESGTGAIHLTNIAGPMRVSTSVGSIIARLLSGSAVAESFLATGNGDITVVIPSNVGVNIRAENDLADSIKRIVTEFPTIPVRMEGTQVVAEGAVNGGGPLLRISGTGGTISILRQH